MQGDSLSRRLWTAVIGWFGENCPSRSAAIAFYTILSLPPFLVLALATATVVVDSGVAVSELQHQVSGLIGTEGAALIASMVTRAGETHYSGVAALIAIGAMLFAATAAIAELQGALDALVGVPSRRPNGTAFGTVTTLVRVRLLGLAMALALGFLIVVSLIMSAIAASIVSWVGASMPASDWLLVVANEVLSTLLVTVVFFALLRFLPSEPLEARACWIGALVSGMLFGIAKFAIAWYLKDAAGIDAYGTAGSVVVVMLWVYYVACIFLLGTLVARESSWKRARYPKPAMMPFVNTRTSRFYLRR
jgi:membrane protein